MTTPRTDGPIDDGAPHPGERSQPAKALERYEPEHLARVAAAPVSQRNETASAMLAARTAKEIEVRALMAERHPRKMDLFRERMLNACKRPIFADQAMYEKPVGGGKTATGLSIRFAEEAMRHYGNAEVSVSILAEDDESRTIEAVGVDYEVNLVYRAQARVPKYVERLNTRPGDEILGQRTNSRGVMTYRIRANDDALFTISQNAAAKASREVSLKLIPSDIREECESEISKALAAIGGDPEKFLKQLLEKFLEVGVVAAQLEKLVGKSLGVLNTAELSRLKRIFNAIKQGETTWDDVMTEAEKKTDVQKDGGETTGSTKSGAEKLKTAAKQGKPAETKADATTEAPAPAKTDCADCGVKAGQPHKSECPHA
jgi:hypothetical protein